MKIENSVTYLLTKVSVAYRNLLQSAMNELGLHGGQIFVLISLWESDGQSQIDLVKNLELASPTVNRMIASLERNGFVERRKCGSDGRIARVYLTAKGVQAEIPVENQWTKLEAETLSNLTETEKLILQQIFGKLRDSLGRKITPPSNET